MNFKLSLFIFSCVLFYGCITKSNIEIQTYGALRVNDKDKVVGLELSQFRSFDDLLGRIDAIVCSDSIPSIRMNIDNEKIQLILWASCSNEVCMLIKKRNILEIKDEKVVQFKSHGLDSLEQYMAYHYNNQGRLEYLSEHPEKAMIAISYEEVPIVGLDLTLEKVVRAFKGQNVHVPLILTLQQLPPPPEF